MDQTTEIFLTDILINATPRSLLKLLEELKTEDPVLQKAIFDLILIRKNEIEQQEKIRRATRR